MKTLILLACLLFPALCFSQIAVKGLRFIPAGELGFVMEKEFTGEILYMSEFDGRWRHRAGLTFTPLHARMDTFPVYAASSTQVLEGYEVYHNCFMTYLRTGVDFRFTEDKKLSPYIGADLIGGWLSLNYDEYYATLIDGSVYGAGGALIGFGFRTGLQYQCSDHLGVFVEGSLNAYMVQDLGKYANYDFGIGIQYLFNPE